MLPKKGNVFPDTVITGAVGGQREAVEARKMVNALVRLVRETIE